MDYYTALEIGFDYLPYWDDESDIDNTDSETSDSETSDELNNIIELPF